MLNLTEQTTESEARLLRVGGRKDASTERVLFDVELAVDLESEEDAEVVGRSIPGAAAAWREAQADGGDGTSADYRRKPSQPDVRCRVVQGDLTMADGPAELRRLWLAVRGRAATLRVLARLFGVEPSKAGLLFGALDQRVRVVVDRPQQELPLGRQPDNGAPSTRGTGTLTLRLPEVGQVATARTPDGPWCGRVVDVDAAAGTVTIADMRATRQVAAEEVVSAVSVRPPKRKTLEQVLAPYEQAAEEAGRTPTWADLLLAGAQHWGGGEAGDRGDEGWTLTEAVVTRARAGLGAA